MHGAAAVGLAEWKQTETSQALIERADRAMYEGKRLTMRGVPAAGRQTEADMRVN